MPGADELFRPTVPARGAETNDPEPKPAEPAPRAKHDEKMTVYLTSAELLELEKVRLELRGMLGAKIDRGRIVRAALAAALEDFETNGETSDLFGRLSD